LKTIPNILSIAGSDPSGGAGVQADLKTFAALGCYGMAVMTALTAQNTKGVSGIHEVPADFVEAQIRAVFEDVRVDAVKIGMIGALGTVEAVARVLEEYQPAIIVLDPVMVATSGDMLVTEQARAILQERLMSLASVVTPNIPEGEVLLGRSIENAQDAAQALVDEGARAALLKGGHLPPDVDGMIHDVLAMSDRTVRDFAMPKLDVPEMHGTGCTQSSALACYLALGYGMEEAVAKAQGFIAEAIRLHDALDVGSGAKPLHHSFLSIAPYSRNRPSPGMLRRTAAGLQSRPWGAKEDEGEALGEFDMIEQYFAPLSLDGLRNDGAVLEVPEGMQLVVSSDTLNEGVHFMRGAAPADIAAKAMRANVSDLASMGARPYAYQLALAFTDKPDAAWLAEFSGALAQEQERFGLTLSGGDTTSNAAGGVAVSVTAFGLVPEGTAMQRAGAQAGDFLVVSGALGDAVLGLEVLRGRTLAEADYFVERYTRPSPRVELAQALRDVAHACVDISDGLVADAGHIAGASGLRVVVELDKVPLSDAARAAGLEALRAATGGDDYELAFAIAPEDWPAVQEQAKALGVAVSVAGCFESGDGVDVLDETGQAVDVNATGWTHF